MILNWYPLELILFSFLTLQGLCNACVCMCIYKHQDFESVSKFERNKGLQDVTILQALRKSPPQNLHYRKNKFISLHRGANSQNMDL